MTDPKELTGPEQLAIYRNETRRLRDLFTSWANNVEPNKNYSGRWIGHMVTSILEGNNQ